MRSNEHNYLIHYGKKGMKWGYNDGSTNGKRTAGEEKNNSGTVSEDSKDQEEKNENTSETYENGLDKSKYTRVKLKNGKYVYKFTKEYEDFKKTDSLRKTGLRLTRGSDMSKAFEERDKRWNDHLKKLENDRTKKKETESQKTSKSTNSTTKQSSVKKSSNTTKTSTSSGIQYGTAPNSSYDEEKKRKR